MQIEENIKLICKNCYSTFGSISSADFHKNELNPKYDSEEYLKLNFDFNFFFEISDKVFYDDKNEFVFKLLLCTSCNKLIKKKNMLGKYIVTTSKKMKLFRYMVFIEKKSFIFKTENKQKKNEKKENEEDFENFKILLQMTTEMMTQVERIEQTKYKMFLISKNLYKKLK